MIGAFYTLEGAQARAVNPTTNTTWWKLLGEVLQTSDGGLPIAQENTYGGFKPEIGSAQGKAVRGKGKKVHYQQKNGGQENTTAIVPICTDGTALPPSIIMKSKAYQV